MSLSESARRHDEMVRASNEQRARIGEPSAQGDRWSAAASRFTADPRREPDVNLRAIMEYVKPDHVLIDVGGGAGRYSLPIALCCREVINVEPSRGMGEAFEASTLEAKIANARWVAQDWLSAKDVTGDVSLVANVTYFVPAIVPFLEKLSAASRERVIIATVVTPPPNQGAALYELLNGEPLAPVPGFRELIPVLWDMGIVPEVRLLGGAVATALGGVLPSRDEAINASIAGVRSRLSEQEAKAKLEVNFDAIFYAVDGGFRRRPSGDARMMLITWSTRYNSDT